MDPREIDSALYETFASSCDTRQERILNVLGRFNAGELTAVQTLEIIAVELHDHIGDAKILALDRVSLAAAELEQLVHRWQDRLLPSGSADSLDAGLARALDAQAFQSWLQRLVESSKRYSVSVGDSGQVRELQQLRHDIGKALQQSQGGRARADTPVQVQAPRSKRVLLLDDSPISRRLLASTLEQMGHAVATAASATQFWELLGDCQPDLVCLDVNMPDVKGDQICRQLRQREECKDLAVVIFSSLADADLASLAASCGANAYVSKQDGLEALCQRVDELVAGGII